MVDYNRIISSIQRSRDFARPNRFIVDFQLPSKVSASFDNDLLSLNCASAIVPGRAFDIAETSYSGGYRHKKALSTQFTDLECSFYLSEDLIEKQIFDTWQTFIFDSSYQVSAYPDDYYADITVHKISKGKDDEIMASYTFVNAFPINVQDLAQSYESESTIDVLPVTFSYHRWFYSS